MSEKMLITQALDAAIVASNAKTEITTSYGVFTVAGAISLRSRLRGAGSAHDQYRDVAGSIPAFYKKSVSKMMQKASPI